jgi:hypothetical protein
MKSSVKHVLLAVLFGFISIDGAHGIDVPKYTIGEKCTNEYDPEKPKNIFCLTQSVAKKEGKFFNNSGVDIPAGTPVSIVSKEFSDQIRITSLNQDKKIIGVTKNTIPNKSFGLVKLGDGNPDCVYDMLDGDPDCNLISNFDTSKYKKDQILYVSNDGSVTNVKPKKAITVGRVNWVSRADPESFNLQIGEIKVSEISTWQNYALAGESCGLLSDIEIAPDLTCVEDDDGNFILESKFPKKSLGDLLYEKTGFAPDATSWMLIISVVFLIGLIISTVWNSRRSKIENLASAVLGILILGFGIFAVVALIVNVIEPYLRGNPVDFSKKVLGIPQYFYLVPMMIATILRNSGKK